MTGLPYSDLLCALFAYGYVAIVMLVVERLWQNEPAMGRKILHMSVGNIVFFLWLLTSPLTALIVAGSFVLFSLLITSGMQRRFHAMLARLPERARNGKISMKISGKLSDISVSGAGNEFGLVYYCIAFAILAVIFYDRPIVVAAGMLPLALGDGMGAVIGINYGKHPFKITDHKTLEGTLAVFVAGAIGAVAGMVFYGTPLMGAVWIGLVIGAVTAVVEASTPWGLDNIAIPAFAATTFLLLGGVA
jgi:phytol kinase